MMMHNDIYHPQNIPQSVKDPVINCYTDRSVKAEIKEEVKEWDEGQCVEDSNLDTDNIVDCGQYVQVEMNMTK